MPAAIGGNGGNWTRRAAPVLSMVDPATGSVQPVGQTGYTLVMSEEMGGTIETVDAVAGTIKLRSSGSTWRTWYPEWAQFSDYDPVNKWHTNTDYESYYATSKVSLSGGVLNLACDEVTTGPGLNYTAGMICTDPTAPYQYGYYEVRARISGGGAGNWPSFWTTSAAFDSWTSEIDIWESFNNTSYKNNVYTGSWDSHDEFPDQSVWHVYGCKWTATDVTFYRDGTQTYASTVDVTEGHYIILTNGARSSLSPTFSSSLVEFDYVRVWS